MGKGTLIVCILTDLKNFSDRKISYRGFSIKTTEVSPIL
jgi:hypothetical protein